MKILLIISAFLYSVLLSGCSLDASLLKMQNSTLAEEVNSAPFDLVSGELVKTVNGTPNYRIQGTFYDLTESQKTSSGYSIEGAWK